MKIICCANTKNAIESLGKDWGLSEALAQKMFIRYDFNIKKHTQLGMFIFWTPLDIYYL